MSNTFCFNFICMLLWQFTVVISYLIFQMYQTKCKKENRLNEQIFHYSRGLNTVIEVTNNSTILPPLSLPCDSLSVNSSHTSYHKNPLINRSYISTPKKDSVIKLPFALATSTPKGMA